MDPIELLRSDAARSMMPGLALQNDQPPAPVPTSARSTIDAELHLVSLMAALRRVKTWPGSGDMAFIAGLRVARHAAIGAADRERLLSLAWRYRAQLPPGLRAAAPPAPDTLS